MAYGGASPTLQMMIKQKIKLRITRYAIRNTNRKGAALLVVLFIIMAITILSLGFLSRSDVELACGQNMILRTQMDYLAESGLEHAKGLVQNPQDIDSGYWTGATSQQLVEGSNDFYDVTVVRDDPNYCNYIIDCNAYRRKGSETVGRSSLAAELRLDPCIAYWVGKSTTIHTEITINGDVYCDDDLIVNGIVNGDAFSKKYITVNGSVTGQKNESVTPPVGLPDLEYSDFSSQYYYNGSGPYSVQPLDPDYNSTFPGPGVNNPACVYYRNGNLELKGEIDITGMLVVKGDFKLKENCNLTITAVKSFPALLVGEDIKIEDDNQSLTVNGLAQVKKTIDMGDKTGSSLNVIGALCITNDEGIKNTNGCTISITAFPDKAAIETWPTADAANKWSPAAGAFFRSIQRE